MRGASVGPLRASNQAVAEQTMKYAENLKIIASITGEDAKKKMEQVRQQASQLAFQQKLAQKSPEEQAAILRAMGNMNSLQRKNFMDMVNFGSVINTEGAAAASLSGGLRDSVSEAYQAFNEGNLDDARQREINSRYNEQMQKDALAQTNIGLAGAANVGGLGQALAEALGGMLQEVKAATPEAIKAAEEAAKLGIPALAVAGFVGLARVEGKKHYWSDVAVGAGIGSLAGFLITRKHPDARQSALYPWGDTKSAGFTYAARF
jgi:ElaB/YqjD/DUF883 family membrane-anchored ribosome-binding protein